MRWVDSCLRAVPKELFQPRVLERLDHALTVSLSDTEVNRQAPSSQQGNGWPKVGNSATVSAPFGFRSVHQNEATLVMLTC
jgi:hypothetical protein